MVYLNEQEEIKSLKAKIKFIKKFISLHVPKGQVKVQSPDPDKWKVSWEGEPNHTNTFYNDGK